VTPPKRTVGGFVAIVGGAGHPSHEIDPVFEIRGRGTHGGESHETAEVV